MELIGGPIARASRQVHFCAGPPCLTGPDTSDPRPQIVGPKSVGASEGFLGWVAYLGAANAGIPLSIIVKDFGWSAYFTTLLVSCGLAVMLTLPMVNVKSYAQRVARKKAKAGDKTA